MNVRLTKCALIAALLLRAPWATAYGPEGHAMIADMAEQHLTKGAAAEVRRLLALENHTTLDQVSSWPDEIRKAQPATGPGHFVDIPLDAKTYDEARDCHLDGTYHPVPEATCLAVKLPYYVWVLAQPSTPATDAARLQALKWVVHLVGDAHQPLHAEQKDGDGGGTRVHLTYFSETATLHSIWDTSIIEHHYGWKIAAPPDYGFDHGAASAAAASLDSEITPTQRTTWAQETPRDMSGRTLVWIMESHALAEAVYGNGMSVTGTDWQLAYQDYAWPVISDALKRASVRLADVLNGALK